ncbi:AI-2E family transporter [Candidatus Pacearchaeota archaeon]|nr:AI-2E family transporter [Candidatus Pacearchaeota archaeon]
MPLNEESIKQLIAISLILILIAFTFLIIKPIFFSIILGLILAYIFNPIDKRLIKVVRSGTVSACITSLIVVALLGLFTWFVVPILVTQIFNSYNMIIDLDVTTFLKKTVPILFSSDQITANFAATYSTFISTTTQTTLERFTSLIIDFPRLLLKLAVTALVFFYGLRDGGKLIRVLEETMPFNKSLTSRFIKKSKDVTFSVVYGRIIIGIITGLLSGISFYLAGVPNSTLLTFIAILAGVIPIVGPWIVWIPVVASLFISGQTLPAVLLLLYNGLFVSFFDNITHPIFISRQSNLPTSFTLIGMVGGLLVFGIFGVIVGPLVVAYLVTLFEIYLEYNVSKQKKE